MKIYPKCSLVAGAILTGFDATCMAAQQNVPAPPPDPHHVKAVCEHAGTAWLVFLSLCVLVACAKRYGVRQLFRAPKCAIGAVIGGVILCTGLWCQNEWASALGGILIVLSHVFECTAHAFDHLFASPDADTPSRLSTEHGPFHEPD